MLTVYTMSSNALTFVSHVYNKFVLISYGYHLLTYLLITNGYHLLTYLLINNGYRLLTYLLIFKVTFNHNGRILCKLHEQEPCFCKCKYRIGYY